MAVREFDGVTNTGGYLDFSNGNVGAINNGTIPATLLMVLKPLSLPGIDPYLTVARSSSQSLAALYYPAVATQLGWGDDDPGNNLLVNAGLTSGDWQVIGMAKTAGSSVVRMHRKKLGSGSWTHVDTGSGLSSSGAASVAIHISRFASLAQTERSEIRVACAAIWNSVLSDANFVTIEAAASTAGIKAFSPAWLVELNQLNIGTTVVDLTGGGGNQIARVGTTVVTNDDPPWTFDPTSIPKISYPTVASGW